MTICEDFARETESPPPSSSFGASRLLSSPVVGGCGGLWRLPTPSTGPLPRLHADVSGVFGTSLARRPSSLRSATTDASLLPSPVTFLLLFAGSLFVGSSTGAIGPGRSRSINSSRSFPPTQLGNTHISFDSLRHKKIVRFLRFLAGCFSDLVEGPAG